MKPKLPDALNQCLRELNTHCENLQAQSDALLSENSALKSKISSLAPLQVLDDLETIDGGAVVPANDTLPRDNSKNSKSIDNLPQRVELWDASEPADKHPTTKGQPGAAWTDVTPTQASPKSQTTIDTTHKNVDNTLETLASARLGMLTTNPVGADTELDPLQSILDTFQVFEAEPSNDMKNRSMIERIANSVFFKFACIMAIAANTIHIGSAADHQVKNAYKRILGERQDAESHIIDISFTCWFSVELLVRACAEGRLFFTGEDRTWNLLDVFLVAFSCAEYLFFSAGNLSFLRIFRVFRLVRVVRVVRTVKALKSLRTMVFAIMNSFVSLMWAFVMIVLIIFVFGIILSSAVAEYFSRINLTIPEKVDEAKEVNLSLGSLYETMVSLWCAITGGNDWMAYGELVRKLNHGEFYFAVFCFYVGFCLVGMLNVVTGIFVDSAVCTRTEDEVVECFKEDMRRTSEEVKRIFKEADTDGSGTICFKELQRHLETPWVKAYFAGLDIDPSEARIIFTLIDTDGSDSVSIEEFVEGTMKLKGSAKSIDVLSMMFDSARFQIQFNTLCGYIEDQMRDIKMKLAPESLPEARTFASVEQTMANTNRHTRLRSIMTSKAVKGITKSISNLTASNNQEKDIAPNPVDKVLKNVIPGSITT